MQLRFILCLAACLATSTAWADRTASQACAHDLPAEARLIYDAALPDAGHAADLRALLTDRTKALVTSGRVSRLTARDSAMAAGACLQKLH